MKKLAFAVLTVLFVVSLAYAQDTMTLKGTIIDNMCAGGHKADMDSFIKTHPKSCATMPACAASGYSIYADGKLMKFDTASNAKIAEFLKGADSTLNVVVEAKKAKDGTLSLVLIKNQ